ncbi:hypothetical protein Tco_0602067 [Tanacetum coccineum]
MLHRVEKDIGNDIIKYHKVVAGKQQRLELNKEEFASNVTSIVLTNTTNTHAFLRELRRRERERRYLHTDNVRGHAKREHDLLQPDPDKMDINLYIIRVLMLHKSRGKIYGTDIIKIHKSGRKQQRVELTKKIRDQDVTSIVLTTQRYSASAQKKEREERKKID